MIENINSLNLLAIYIDFDFDTPPKWGKMSFQHMLEHLSDSLKTSNGGIVLQKPDVPAHIFDSLQKFLMGKNEFPNGFINPLIGENLPKLRLPSIPIAINELQTELNIYADFWHKNHNASFFNPTFGTLKFEQWQKLHAKHFTHHFKQFGIEY